MVKLFTGVEDREETGKTRAVLRGVGREVHGVMYVGSITGQVECGILEGHLHGDAQPAAGLNVNSRSGLQIQWWGSFTGSTVRWLWV